MQIHKAVIPAGGRGSRVRGAAGGVPKEMIPVGGRPMIAYCIEEAILAGIREICVILSPDKECVREYLDVHFAGGSKAQGSDALGGCKFHYAVQSEPTGLANALALARDFVGNAPFAYMLPDEVFLGSVPAILQVAQVAVQIGRHTLGLQRRQRSDGHVAF